MEARARLVTTLFILSSIISSLAPAFAYFRNNNNNNNNGIAKPKPKPPSHGKPKTSPQEYEFKGDYNVQFNPFDGDSDTIDESSATYNNDAYQAMAKGKEALRVGYYTHTCPQAEKIVHDIVAKRSQYKADLPAGFVRIFFHDCFVSGCDASILLDKTPTGERVEKESPANAASLKGLDVIDEIKAALEHKCPQTVSCSDILAFAARDSMVLSGVPHFPIPSGRRDSLSSRESDVNEISLPGPAEPLDNIIATFAKNGLTVEDMVVLTGAHSIGVAHCPTVAYRPFQPNAVQELDWRLRVDIEHICTPVNEGAVLPFDPVTNYEMDGYFYKTVLDNKALLESDQKMGMDPRTGGYVRQMANDEAGWLRKFRRSFAKMGNMHVITGENGEVRQNCRFVN